MHISNLKVISEFSLKKKVLSEFVFLFVAHNMMIMIYKILN
jgi:hypothetical protein